MKTPTKTIEQEEDCCGRVKVKTQSIDIEFPDGGGGAYAVLKTERFALDTGDDLKAFVKMLKEGVKAADKKYKAYYAKGTKEPA